MTRFSTGLAMLCLGCSNLVVSLGGDAKTGNDAGTGCTYDIDCADVHGLCNADGGCDPLPPDGGILSADGLANTCDPSGATGSQPCGSFAAGGTYCTSVTGDNQCYCHADSYFDQGGICYRAIPECGACTSSVDCGGTEIDQSAICAPVVDAGNFCLRLYQGSCERPYIFGQLDDGEQVCTPACDSCPCIACNTNDDCPVPDAGVCGYAGACIPPCHDASDCPTGKVCNVLGKYLDPSLGSSYYGAGECGPPCSSASDCEQAAAGPALECLVDRRYPDGGPTGDGGPHCRVAGCMNTDECIPSPTDAGGNVWCDLWGGNQCVNTYCQIGVSTPGECQIGYCCSADAGPVPRDDGGPALGVCAQTSTGACSSSSGSTLWHPPDGG